MLNKVASGMLLGLVGTLLSATPVTTESASPYKFSSVLAHSPEILAQTE